jgi:hypothetical protein
MAEAASLCSIAKWAKIQRITKVTDDQPILADMQKRLHGCTREDRARENDHIEGERGHDGVEILIIQVAPE